MDSGQTSNSSGTDSNPAVAIGRSTNPDGKNLHARHRRIRSLCWMRGCNAINDNNRRKPVQIVAEYQLKNVSEQLHKEQKYWIKEAVAEETQ